MRQALCVQGAVVEKRKEVSHVGDMYYVLYILYSQRREAIFFPTSSSHILRRTSGAKKCLNSDPVRAKKEPDYLLWGCFRWSFASASTPAGGLLQLIHGLDEGARGAKPGCAVNPLSTAFTGWRALRS
jgi:hypothetical protein